jgi:hypothetical protein
MMEVNWELVFIGVASVFFVGSIICALSFATGDTETLSAPDTFSDDEINNTTDVVVNNTIDEFAVSPDEFNISDAPVITVNNSTVNTLEDRPNLKAIMEYRRSAAARSGGSSGSSGGSSGHSDSDDDSSSSGDDFDSSDDITPIDTNNTTDNTTDNTTNNTQPIFVPSPSYDVAGVVVDVAGQGAGGAVTRAGDVIKYQITAVNTGNVNLTNTSLTAVSLSLTKTESIIEDGMIQVNETWLYNGTYNVTQNDLNTNGGGSGYIGKTATIKCDQFQDPRMVNLNVPLNKSASYAVTETAYGSISKPGDAVNFAVSVTNTGNVDIANILVEGTLTSFSLTSGDNAAAGVLNPGETWVYTGTYTGAQDDLINYGGADLTNVVTVKYDNANAQSVSASAHVNYKYTSTYAQTNSWFAVGADKHKILLVNNNSAVNPTYQQLVDFLKADKTDMIPYSNDSFVCADYAERLHQNAEAAGFKCAWVSIDFSDNTVSHACNLFTTSDNGTVAIDCTRVICQNCTLAQETANCDTIATLEVAKPYTRTGLYVHGFEYSPYGNTSHFDIFP